MKKYDADYDVFEEFIRSLLASFHIRYDAEAWQAMQEKLDKRSGEKGGNGQSSSGLTNRHNSNNSDGE